MNCANIRKALSEELLVPLRELGNAQASYVLREACGQPWTNARFRWLAEQVRAGAQLGYWQKKGRLDRMLHEVTGAVWDFLDGKDEATALRHVAEARGHVEAAAADAFWRRDGAHSDPVEAMHKAEQRRVIARDESLKRLGAT